MNILKYLLLPLAVLFVGAAFAHAADVKPTTTTVSVEKATLTKDNIVVMNDYFSGSSVATVAQQARLLDSKLPSGDPLYLILDSGGGSIDAGIELIENLNRLNRPVKTLTIFAASMGFQTVQGVRGERLIQEQGTLMSHKARGGFYGEFPGQLDSRYTYYLRRVQMLDQKVVGRTSGKHTLKSYQSLIENEYWCDGVDCVKQGFADKVVRASCDNSLNGVHEKLWDRFIYMGMVIEIVDTFADCPLTTSELSYQIYINGEPLFEGYKNKTVTSTDTYSYKTKPLEGVTLETAENIKKLVSEKLNNRVSPSTARRQVQKY